MSGFLDQRSAAPGWALRLYHHVSPVLCQLLPQAASFSPKLNTGVAGRRDLMRRLLDEAPRLRGCVWFHASSVGEYEQARPLIAALRQEPDAPPIVMTHFSPSGLEFARRQPCADLHDYLPFDHPEDMARLLDAWQPRLLVFTDSDCWPNLVLAADRRGVPLALLAGSFRARSLGLRWPGRILYRDVFARFAHVGVCTAKDRQRFVERLDAGCPVSETGNTRIEQVVLRWEESQTGAVAAALQTSGRSVLVLGSTWPPDEQLWLPILPELLTRFPTLRVILVPHEPRPERLAQLESQLAASRIPSLRLSNMLEDPAAATATSVILVDSVGVLAEIYRTGDLAYVGGSFTTGVHNTMEPAVAGLPVLFGPRIGNAPEAGELVRHGVGFVLETPQQALAVAMDLLADKKELERLGTTARRFVLDQRGATVRSLAVIRELLADS